MSKTIQLLKKLPIDVGQGEKKYNTAGKRIAFSSVEEGMGNIAVDVGCRDGYWTERLRKRGYRVYALDSKPDYPEAIEYRAELFLLTGRLAQTKESYATLLKLDPAYAGMLKTSMQDFLKAGKAFPASVTAKESEDFAKWVSSL